MNIQVGKKYRILFRDSYYNRVAVAKYVDQYGDVLLEFKNGKTVQYHASWLIEA